MAKTGGVDQMKTKSGTSSRAWIKCGQIPKVNGPSRRNPEDAAADLIKLLAVSREDLHRLASDLKDAAKKKTCVEKHGQGWRSVVRVGKKIAHGPVRATQDVAERDVISTTSIKQVLNPTRRRKRRNGDRDGRRTEKIDNRPSTAGIGW